MDAPEGVYTALKKQFSQRGIPISHSVLIREVSEPLKLHPLVNKIQHLHWTFWSSEEELRILLDNVSELTEEQLVELKLPEFMPQADYSTFVGYARQEARARASLVKSLHRSLFGQVNQTTV
jgi:hypothetical protein